MNPVKAPQLRCRSHRFLHRQQSGQVWPLPASVIACYSMDCYFRSGNQLNYRQIFLETLNPKPLSNIASQDTLLNSIVSFTTACQARKSLFKKRYPSRMKYVSYSTFLDPTSKVRIWISIVSVQEYVCRVNYLCLIHIVVTCRN